MIVEALRQTGATRVAIYLAMVRTTVEGSTGWEYAVIDADGWVAPGSSALCARCHSEAPRDGLFGKYAGDR